MGEYSKFIGKDEDKALVHLNEAMGNLRQAEEQQPDPKIKGEIREVRKNMETDIAGGSFKEFKVDAVEAVQHLGVVALKYLSEHPEKCTTCQASSAQAESGKKPTPVEIAKAEQEITRLEEAYHGPEERRYRQLEGKGGNPVPQKCELEKEEVEPKGHFDPKSFRTICPQSPTGYCKDLPSSKECGTRVIVGCSKGNYIGGKCQVGMRAQSIHHGRG